MSAVRRVVVDLDEKAAKLIDRKVASGRFANDADVVQRAVSDMMLEELFDALPIPSEAELDTIFKAAVAEYLANPEDGQDLDEAFDELEAEWAADRRR